MNIRHVVINKNREESEHGLYTKDFIIVCNAPLGN